MGQLPHLPLISLEEPAQTIAVAAVPFGPAAEGREAAHLVKAAGIPGFGDQLAGGEDRIKGQGLKQRWIGEGGTPGIAAENRGQIKTEAVDVIFGRPVAQAIEHKIAHHRVVAVQGIARTAEIEVIPLRGEHVVGPVVQALERQGGSVLIALGGVVEHHIENHLDAGTVQLLDQLLELIDLHPEAPGCGIGGLGCEETDGAVAPEVIELLAGIRMDAGVFKFIELIDRHQLNGVDAQLLQVGNLLHQARIGAGIAGR